MIKCNVSTDGLTAAINERLKYPGRTEAEIVNTAAYYVALNTLKRSPYAQIEKIDSELDAMRVPSLKIDKSGAVKISSRQKRKFSRIGGKVLLSTGKAVPLAALIVAARASSHYKGNPKWKLDKNPFKGVSAVAGRSAMARLTNTMLSARHSSTHFLRSGWIMAITVLKDLAIRRLSRGGLDREATAHDYGAPKGDVIPAKEGRSSVFAMIENNIGKDFPVDPEKVQAAVEAQQSGPLQDAINEEERLMREYMLTHTQVRNDKFNQMAA